MPRFQREAEDAKTECEVLKRQIPSLSLQPASGGEGLTLSPAQSLMELQRSLASKEVAAGVAREAKEIAEVESLQLQAALDECRSEVRTSAGGSAGGRQREDFVYS